MSPRDVSARGLKTRSRTKVPLLGFARQRDSESEHFGTTVSSRQVYSYVSLEQFVDVFAEQLRFSLSDGIRKTSLRQDVDRGIVDLFEQRLKQSLVLGLDSIGLGVVHIRQEELPAGQFCCAIEVLLGPFRPSAHHFRHAPPRCFRG